MKFPSSEGLKSRSARILAAAVAIPLSLAALYAGFRAAFGAGIDYKQARHLEESGRAFEAVAAFVRFTSEHPGDPRVPEAAFRAGRIYAEGLDRCAEAVPLLEAAARSRSEPWAGSAITAILSCPDYFPLREGFSWTYVDSESGGEFARMEVDVSASSAGVRGELRTELFAGERRVMEMKKSYAKEDWIVWETSGSTRTPILKYPFRAGRSWEIARGGSMVRFEVVADGLAVETKAGGFTDCLKVQERTAALPSWTYKYYCPGVGQVKTTVGVPGAENPDNELASYVVPPG